VPARATPEQPAAVIGRRMAFENMIRSKGSKVEKEQQPRATFTDDYC
jgi:hypothetical protein